MKKGEPNTVQESALQDTTLAALETEASLNVKRLVLEFNGAVEAEDAVQMQLIEPQLKEALKLLNSEERAAQLTAWAGTEKPVESVLRSGGEYALTALSKHKDMGTYELDGKTDIVDLADLFRLVPKAFANHNWLAYTEAANIAIRDYIVNVMKIKTMSEKHTAFKLSVAASALGITMKDMRTAKGSKGALQKVVDSILGSGYIVEDEDGEALRLNYSAWGNKAITSVALCMEARFRKQLTRILVRIVNDLEYSGE